MLTNEGYFQQVHGLDMGSPPAPHLVNAWMNKFDSAIRDNATLYSRYMNDILRDIDKNSVQIDQINNLYSSLKFTIEEENSNSIAIIFNFF